MLLRVFGAIAITVLMAIPAQAGLIITVGNATFVEGDAGGTIDVFARAQAGTTVQLDSFELELLITPGTQRQIRFADTQLSPGLIDDPNYVFFTPGGNPLGNARTVGFPNNTFEGNDFSNSGPATINDTTDVLLTRVQFVPGPDKLAPLAGDVFTISLIDEGTLFLFFPEDETLDIIEYGFESESGTVTVQSNVIPEPSSMVLFFGLAASAVVGGRLRRRFSRPTCRS